MDAENSITNKTKIIIGIAGLYFLLLYSLFSFLLLKKPTSNESMDLLTFPVHQILGELTRTKDQISINLDSKGVGLFLFDTDKIDTKKFNQLVIGASNFYKNFKLELVFLSQKNEMPNQIRVLQPTLYQTHNQLYLHKDWQNEIQALGFRITPQDEMGLAYKPPESIVIKHARLNNSSFSSSYFSLANYWLDYQPWEYLSISHLENKANLSWFYQPQTFIVFWLIMMLFTFLKFKKGTWFIWPILFAWAFVELLFLVNTHKQTSWTKTEYSVEQKLLADENLSDLAITIAGIINDDQGFGKDKKILVASEDYFSALRTIYHLLPLNAGFINNLDNQEKITQGNYFLVFKNSELAKNISPFIYAGENYVVDQVYESEEHLLLKVMK